MSRKIFGFMGAILLCLIVIGGCGGGNPNPVVSDAGTQQSDEKGNLAVNLVWNTPEGQGKFAAPSTVVNVKVNVSATDISTLSQTYAASAGTGTVSDVPAGSGRTVTGYGFDGSGRANYTGTATNITVTGGQTTQVTIVLSAVASSTGLDWPHSGYDTRNSRYASKASSSQTLTGWTSASATLPGNGGGMYVGDVNGDNVNDIVAGSSGKVSIYSGSGALQKTITVSSGDYPTTLLDINGDGVLDIGMSTSGGVGKAYFLSGSSGSEIWSYTRSVGYDGGVVPLYLINGKLILSAVSGYSLQPRGVILLTPSATTGTESWFYSQGPCQSWDSISATDTYITSSSYTCHNGASGNGVSGTGTTTTDSSAWYFLLNFSGGEVFAKQANGVHTDGWDPSYILPTGKILGLENHDPTYYSGTSKIRLLDTTGTETAKVNLDTNQDWLFPAFDSTRIVVGGTLGTVRTFSASDLTINATKIYSGKAVVGAMHDLNGDGTLEVVVTSDTTVYVLSADSLTEIASYQFDASGTVGVIRVADVTGDAKADIVVMEKAKLFVYSSSFQTAKGAIQVSW